MTSVWELVASADLGSWLLGCTTIAGTLGTLYFGFEARYLTKQRVRFSWSEVEWGARSLGRLVKRSAKPELVLCFAGPSAIVANLLLVMADLEVPILLLPIERVKGKSFAAKLGVGWKVLETAKWRIFVPEMALGMAGQVSRVTIIDDCVRSGDSIVAVRKLLLEAGFTSDGIRTYSLIASDLAMRENKGPDKAVHVLEGSRFFLPWGAGY